MFERKRKIKIIPELKDEIFLANQIDLRFYPDMFKIEFKQINEQVDRIGDSHNSALIINRRTIALTPLMMKQFVKIVSNVVANYEKKYGELKLAKRPKKRKVTKVKNVSSSAYIG